MTKQPCPQCVATNKNGNHCRIKTCKYHRKCWIHTQGQDKLAIAKSTIPNAGNGLYTMKDRQKGEKIADYLGKTLTKDQLEKKYPGDTLAPYAVKAGKNKFIDAEKTPSGMGRYANHARGQRQNAELVSTRDKKVKLVAKKKIVVPNQKKGKKEILVNYGSEYWTPTNKK